MNFCACEYPFDEFAQHFEAVEIVRNYEYVNRQGASIFIGEDRSYESNVIRVFDYFQQLYEKEVAQEKASAFMQIVGFLAEHLGEFDTETFAVRGEANEGLSLVSEPLLRAVHYAWMNMTEEEHNGNGPSVETIKQLARSKFAHFK